MGGSRPHRIRGTDQFRPAFLQRPRARGDCFDVFSADIGGTAPRLGVVVPKRICRLANRRNLLKRIVRESFRMIHQRLPAQDWVVRLRRPLVAFERHQLRSELDALWRSLAR